MKNELLYELLAELRELLDPLFIAAGSAPDQIRLLREAGWNVEDPEDAEDPEDPDPEAPEDPGYPGDADRFPLAELAARLAAAEAVLTTLTDAIDDPPDDLAGYADVLAAVRGLYELLAELRTLGAGLDPSIPFDRLGADLTEYLTVEYLRRNHPLVHDLAVLLTVIVPDERVPPELSDPYLLPPARPGLHLDRLPALLRDPVAVLRAAYFPSGRLDTAEDARQVTDKLFPRVGDVLTALGWGYVYGVKPMYELDFGETGNQLGSGMLTVFRYLDETTVLGATFALSPSDLGGLGLTVVPYGLVTMSRELGAWLLILEAQAALDGFAIGPYGLTLPESLGDVAVRVDLALLHAPDEDSGFVFGGTGPRLEAEHLSIEATAAFEGRERDYGLLARAEKAALVLAAGKDGFLRSVLGEQELRAEFELGIGWSNRRGLYLEGSAGLETRIQVGRELTPVVRVDAVDVGVTIGDEALSAQAGITFTVRLGPMAATVEGMGLRAQLDLGQETGNLGLADLSFGAEPPEGITLAVDSGPLTGGGFLHLDAEKGEYSGLVRLKHGNLVFTAVGVLSTKRPDGRPGYSLVLVITGEFPPVQLGLGFTLNGLGGLLGVNRTANVQALRNGVRTGALDAVLFPEKPLENAPRIISDLQAFFPRGDGTHVFGPMAKIGWGPVPILLAELGIALEFPDPLRLLLFGRLRLGLPSLDKPLMDARLDLFGSLDLEAGMLAIDASLVDSTIAGYRMDGEAAIRARWKGENPDFALAIGGFHPQAKPPEGFPTSLRRVSVNLTKSDNPRVRLSGYFALTANTVQCGAQVEAYAKKGRFSAEASLSFDTLFQFDPFRFVADLEAGAVIKAFGRTVTTVDLRLGLSGPRPWHASGQASFRVIWRYKVDFDLTVGDRPDTAPVASADLRALLVEELRRPSSWSGQSPPRSASPVALRDSRPDTGGAVLHPQGRFGVRQTVLPLGTAVDKYGEKPPKDDAHFVIGQVYVDGRPVAHSTVQDRFAPAQYFDMTETQRLASPAYRLFDSGLSAVPDTATGGDRVSVRPQYEEVTVDAVRGHRVESAQRAEPPDGTLDRVHQRGPLAGSLRRRRDTVAFPGPKQRIRLARRT